MCRRRGPAELKFHDTIMGTCNSMRALIALKSLHA